MPTAVEDVCGKGEALWRRGGRAHLQKVLAWPATAHGLLATCAGGLAVAAPAVATSQRRTAVEKGCAVGESVAEP